MEEQSKPKSKKKMYALIGTGAGLLGLTIFGIWWLKGRNGNQSGNEEDLMFKLANKPHTPSHKQGNDAKDDSGEVTLAPTKTSIKTPPTFPLKKGQRSEKIKQLQEGLIKQYGANIFSGKKATGFYGDETAKILKEKGLPAIIDEETFNKVISEANAQQQPSTSTAITDQNKVFSKDAIDIAKNIWLNCSKRNLDGLVQQLERIKDVKQYVAVNTLFKTIRTDGVRQTIVNAALSSFFLATDKLVINEQFERIGLKYDGTKWSLSGMPQHLITSRYTTISSLDGIELDVPAHTLLGERISERSGLTKFRASDGQILCVPSHHVKDL